jgi:GDP-4-dehydro-6-deoxy-D-mannose reductase
MTDTQRTNTRQKQVFVTGATGFVGQHFRHLIDVTSDWSMIPAPAEFDLRSNDSVMRTIANLPRPPDAVLHLAAQSNVPQSFADPQGTFDINFTGTLRLLQALKKSRFNGRFLFVGTADAYGLVPDNELPVSESRPLKPRNPYAVSKTAAEALVYQWSQSESLDAVLVRPFNHIGPGQDERFAVATFAKQIAEIILGKRTTRIEVGDIEVTRDFTDVRDVVRAYLALLTQGTPGKVYNIGSGIQTQLRNILSRLTALANVEIEIIQDPQRMRAAEQHHMCADTRCINEAIGWQPQISMDQTLVDILNYWKEKLTHG